MNPLKIAAAVAVCALLFWLMFRLTRKMVDLTIATGLAEEERRRKEEER